MISTSESFEFFAGELVVTSELEAFASRRRLRRGTLAGESVESGDDDESEAVDSWLWDATMLDALGAKVFANSRAAARVKMRKEASEASTADVAL